MSVPRLRPLHLLVLAGLSTLVLVASAFQQAQSTWSAMVPWGLTVNTDRIYYAVGDTLAARFQIANYSGQTAWGWVANRGGDGCLYRFSVYDAAGNAVWLPGTISGGTFHSPGCMFAETNTLYASGSTRKVERLIPLIYQNPGGFGTLGAPLAPGAYELRVQVYFHGPKRVSGSPTSPGTHFTAGVPFRIE